MEKYKLYGNTPLIQKLALLGAGACILTVFAGCGKNDNKNESVPQTEITEEVKQQVPAIRDDGSDLVILATLNKENNTYTFNAGYLTFDKNGVYFDDAISKKKLMLEEVLSKQPGTEFCVAKLKNLLPKSKFEEETTNSINDIFEIITEESGPTSEQVNIDLIKDYLKRLIGVDYMYKRHEPYMFSIEEYNENLSEHFT